MGTVFVLAITAPRLVAEDGMLFQGFACPSNTLLPAHAPLTCVMKALDGVRGLRFGPEGALYVAEAGHGGTSPCTSESGVRVCYGKTGAITRLLGSTQQQVITGLPSLAINDPTFPNRTGQTANGPTDIDYAPAAGEQDGEAGDEDAPEWTTYVTIGLRNNPLTARAALGAVGAEFGQLLRIAPNGKRRSIGDLAGYEIAQNPDQGDIDTNPFGLLAEAGSRVVVDSGANALVRVAANGHGPISTIATFRSRAQLRETDSVPTSVAVGPDGAYYVSELTGIPFGTWNAAIYRVVPGEEPELYLDGFKMAIDIVFDASGNLYVLQYGTVAGANLATSGALTRVAPDGTRRNVLTGLRTPTSVAIGPDGFLYVTNRGNNPGVGEVIRVAAPAP